MDIGKIRDAKIELDAWLQLSHFAAVRRHGSRVMRGLEFCQRYDDPPPEARAAVWEDLAEMAKAAGRGDRLKETCR